MEPQKPPYIALVCGAPREGKSYFIEYRLRKGIEEGEFDYGITFIGIQREGLEYLEDNQTIVPYSVANLHNFIKFQAKARGRCFVHFHDCASLVDWSSAFVRAFITGYRHLNLRVFIDVQYVKMIPPTVRSCVTTAYMFRGLNKESVEALYESFGKSTETDGHPTDAREFAGTLERDTGNHYMVVWDYSDTSEKPVLYTERAPPTLPEHRVVFPNPNEIDLSPIQSEGGILEAIDQALPAAEKRRQAKQGGAAKRPRMENPIDVIADEGEAEEPDEPVCSGRYQPQCVEVVEDDGGEVYTLPSLAGMRLSRDAELNKHIHSWLDAFGDRIKINIPDDWETLPSDDKVALLNDIRWDVKCSSGGSANQMSMYYNMGLQALEAASVYTPLKLNGLSALCSTSATPQQDFKADIDRCITEISLEQQSFQPSDPYYRLAFLVAQAALGVHMANSNARLKQVASRMQDPVPEELASRYSEI